MPKLSKTRRAAEPAVREPRIVEPCPHCRNRDENQFELAERGTLLSVRCAKCGATGPMCCVMAGAIRLWNRRLAAA